MDTGSLSLKFLWDFLKPIFGDVMKEKLKVKTPQEKAKKHAFELYRTLQEIGHKTDEFVDALQSFVDLISSSAPEQEVSRRQDELWWIAGSLMHSLPKLADALDRVNPQLEIHQHELVKNIKKYSETRAIILTRLQYSVQQIKNEKIETLSQFLSAADENRLRIKGAIENMRSFLASEFPFKESF